MKLYLLIAAILIFHAVGFSQTASPTPEIPLYKQDVWIVLKMKTETDYYALNPVKISEKGNLTSAWIKSLPTDLTKYEYLLTLWNVKCKEKEYSLTQTIKYVSDKLAADNKFDNVFGHARPGSLPAYIVDQICTTAELRRKEPGK